mmetsp:Transcript_19723/g.62002  ORF Transcript_19723/g.62002 Transcript_19723/m.62002 type:complete len:283 (-) Transcript_19723:92-940(-)
MHLRARGRHSAEPTQAARGGGRRALGLSQGLSLLGRGSGLRSAGLAGLRGRSQEPRHERAGGGLARGEALGEPMQLRRELPKRRLRAADDRAGHGCFLGPRGLQLQRGQAREHLLEGLAVGLHLAGEPGDLGLQELEKGARLLLRSRARVGLRPRCVPAILREGGVAAACGGPGRGRDRGLAGTRGELLLQGVDPPVDWAPLGRAARAALLRGPGRLRRQLRGLLLGLVGRRPLRGPGRRPLHGPLRRLLRGVVHRLAHLRSELAELLQLLPLGVELARDRG